MKLSDFLFCSFIGINLCAAIFAIRIWPLTDYPMFSRPRQPFNHITRYAVEMIYHDHTYEWQIKDHRLIGTKEKIQTYFKQQRFDKIKEMASVVIQKNLADKKERPHHLRIIRITATVNPDGSVHQQRDLIHELPYDQ